MTPSFGFDINRSLLNSDFAGDLFDYRVRVAAPRGDLLRKLQQLPRRQRFIKRAPQQAVAQQLDDAVLGDVRAFFQRGQAPPAKVSEIFDGLRELDYALVLSGDGADNGRLPAVLPIWPIWPVRPFRHFKQGDQLSFGP